MRCAATVLSGCSRVALAIKLADSFRINPAGVPVAWKLAPAPTPPVYAHPTNEHARRGAFATKQLWVTPHSDDEKWPAGKYPLGGDMAGIAEWTSLVSLSACLVPSTGAPFPGTKHLLLHALALDAHTRRDRVLTFIDLAGEMRH
jgi:hypothetical protein